MTRLIGVQEQADVVRCRGDGGDNQSPGFGTPQGAGAGLVG